MPAFVPERFVIFGLFVPCSVFGLFNRSIAVIQSFLYPISLHSNFSLYSLPFIHGNFGNWAEVYRLSRNFFIFIREFPCPIEP